MAIYFAIRGIERSNDEGLGEEVTFQRDGTGKVVSKTRHGQVSLKIGDAPSRPVVPVAAPSVGGSGGSGRAVTTTTVQHSDGTVTTVSTGAAAAGGGGAVARL